MAAATMYVTVAGGGGSPNGGTSWADAFSLAEWEADAEASAEAGDVYYVAGGTYTLTGDFICPNDGTSIAPIKIVGVKSGTTHEGAAIVVSDYANGDDRPLITDTTNNYSFEVDNYWHIYNLRMMGSDASCLQIGAYSKMVNCKATNDSTTEGRYALYANDAQSRVINCEGISTAGYGIAVSYTGGGIVACYAHDSAVGIFLNYSNTFATLCVVDTCVSNGVQLGTSRSAGIISLCTIYNCETGISGGDCTNNLIFNTIISTCTTGISFSVSDTTNFEYYNDIYDCTNDRTNIDNGLFSVDIDPEFTDASGGDFSLLQSSPCINTGITLLGTT